MLKTMEITSIQGDCLVKPFENWIELQRCSFAAFGASHTPGVTAAADRAGKAVVNPLRAGKKQDKASTPIFMALAQGTLLATVKVVYSTHNDNGQRRKVLEITLTNAKVAVFGEETLTDGADGEEVQFTCQKMRMESFTPNGTSSGAVTYNFLTNSVE